MWRDQNINLGGEERWRCKITSFGFGFRFHFYFRNTEKHEERNFMIFLKLLTLSRKKTTADSIGIWTGTFWNTVPPLNHRIENNQKSDSHENLSPFLQCACPSYAILTPSWLVPPALLTFKRHLLVTKADIVLTFCTYKVLYTRKAGGKNCPGELARMAYGGRRWDARGDIREDIDFKGADRESDFWLAQPLELSSYYENI